MNDHIHERFMNAFNSLKRQIDQIPLTTYQRESLLGDMVSMKKQIEDAVFLIDRKHGK